MSTPSKDTDKNIIFKSISDIVGKVKYDIKSYKDYTPLPYSYVCMMFMTMIMVELQGRDQIAKNCIPHLKVFDSFFSEDNVINLCARGFGKTTLVLYFIVMMIFLRRHPLHGSTKEIKHLALIVSGDEARSEYQSAFKQIILESEIVRSLLKVDRDGNVLHKIIKDGWEVFPKYEPMDIVEYIKNPAKYLKKAKKTKSDLKKQFFKVSVRTIGGNIRGMNHKGCRVDICFADDLMKDSVAKSAKETDNISETMDKAVPALGGTMKLKIIWNGTPFNEKDPLVHKAKYAGWKVNAYPLCEQFPCKEEDYRSFNNERFEYKDVLKLYTSALNDPSGKEMAAFKQERMLELTGSADRLISDEDILYYTYRSHILNRRSNYNFYITTDFAYTTNNSSDYTAISVWAIDGASNIYYVDGSLDKQDINSTITKVLNFCGKYSPRSVGIEVNGIQKAFPDIIRKSMQENRVATHIVEIASGQAEGGKFDRFRQCVFYFKQKKIFFPEEFTEEDSPYNLIANAWKYQLSQCTRNGFKGNNDDLIDSISALPQMHLIPPRNMPTHNRSRHRLGNRSCNPYV